MEVGMEDSSSVSMSGFDLMSSYSNAENRSYATTSSRPMPSTSRVESDFSSSFCDSSSQSLSEYQSIRNAAVKVEMTEEGDDDDDDDDDEDDNTGQRELNQEFINESDFNESRFNQSGMNETQFDESGMSESHFNESGMSESRFDESGMNYEDEDDTNDGEINEEFLNSEDMFNHDENTFNPDDDDDSFDSDDANFTMDYCETLVHEEDTDSELGEDPLKVEEVVIKQEADSDDESNSYYDQSMEPLTVEFPQSSKGKMTLSGRGGPKGKRKPVKGKKLLGTGFLNIEGVVNEPVEAKFRLSQSGRPLLIDPFCHEYRKSQEKNGRIYYVCCASKFLATTKCLGTAIVKDDMILKTSPHSHLPNPHRLATKLIEQDIFESIKNDPLQPSSELIDRWVEQMTNEGYEVEKSIRDQMLKKITRMKSKLGGSSSLSRPRLSKSELESSDVVVSPCEARFQLSQKGRPLLIDPFCFEYRKSQEKNGRTYYVCCASKFVATQKCTGTAIVVGDMIVKTSPHTHLPNPHRIAAKVVEQEILESVKVDPFQASSSLIEKWSEQMTTDGYEIDKTARELMLRKISRIKAKFGASTSTPRPKLSRSESESSEVVTSPVEARFQLSQKGRPLLIDPFCYEYRKSQEKNGRVYYVCSASKVVATGKCTGTAIVVGEMILKTSPHTHLPNPQRVAAKVVEQEILESVKMDPFQPSSNLIEKWSEQMALDGYTVDKTARELMMRKISRIKAKFGANDPSRKHKPSQSEMEFKDLVTEPVEPNFRMSQNGKPILIDPYYYEYRKNQDKNGRSYYTCCVAQSPDLPKCYGTAIVVDNLLVKTSAHNHPPDPIRLTAKLIDQEILEEVKANPLVPTSVFVQKWTDLIGQQEVQLKTASREAMIKRIKRVKEALGAVDSTRPRNSSKANPGDEESMNVVTNPVEAKFRMSQNRRPLLIDPFCYEYRKNQDKKGKSYYTCCVSQTLNGPKCYGCAIVQDDLILKTSAHNHPPDPLRLVGKLIEQEIMEAVQTDPTQPTAFFVEQWIERITSEDGNIKMLSKETMMSKIQRAKSRLRGTLLPPKKPPPPKDENVGMWPIVTSPVEAAFRLSQAGKQMLIDPFQYEYTRNVQKNGKSYFKCVNLSKNENKCLGKAIVQEGTLIRTTHHNHPPDPLRTIAKLIENEIFESIKEEPTQTTASLIEKWNFQRDGSGQALTPLSRDAMAKKIERWRGKITGSNSLQKRVQPTQADPNSIESWYVVSFPVEAKYRISQFGKSILIDPFGFEYFKSRDRGSGTHYVCSRYRQKSDVACKAKALVKDNQIIKTTAHNHMWESDRTASKMIEQDIFESIWSDPDQSTASLMEKWASQLSSLENEFDTPNTEDMERKILRAKERARESKSEETNEHEDPDYV